jgi:phosphatidylserine/phosphatidylglycerophosphate/cardiolipin synthase-like enzyme
MLACSNLMLRFRWADMAKHLISPWTNAFDALVEQSSKSLLICSPFVGRGPCERIALNLQRRNAVNTPVLLLTDLSRDNMLSGGTDVSAIAGLCDALPRTEVRFLPNLHAKVYIADERFAVVTSANLTDSGLYRNHEYGMYIDESELVKQITADITQYASLGSPVNLLQLRQFERVVNELKELKVDAEKQFKASLRKEFKKKMQAADEEVLRVRAESLSQHSAFANTVLFLLKQGPKDTKTLYAAAQGIHPDLCDDSIKLVIKGEVWDQERWHHQVREAVLSLRRKGRIEQEGGKGSKYYFVH